MDALSALQKAMIIVVDGFGVPMALRFRYNPEQYSIEKSAEWTRPQVAGTESTPKPQFSSTNPATVSMEIFFDAFEELAGDVSGDVETLFTWTRPTPLSLDAGYPQPPLLSFLWGVSSPLNDFVGYLRSASARYTMFRVDGTPIRATCNITLEEYPQDAEGTNPTSGSPPGMRIHTLTEGETLHSVAWAEYRNASYWRALAIYNNIDDPLRVQPGATLLLPAQRDAARLS